MYDVVEVYVNVYGFDYSEKVCRGFVDVFKKCWDEIYLEGDK